MEQADLFADLLDIFEPPPPPPAPEPELPTPAGPQWICHDTRVLGDLTGKLVVLSPLYSGGLAREFKDYPVLLCLEGDGCRPDNPTGAVYGRQWNSAQKQEVTAWCRREAIDRLAEPQDLEGHPCFGMGCTRGLSRETWPR